MKKIAFLIITISLLHNLSFAQTEKKWQGPSVDFKHGNLKISDNKRFIEFADGTPFFYLGDTGWELFHRLTKDETEKYLENRRQKGFTVIQAVVLAELDGLNTPNMEGNKPLIDNDPLKPNEAYFQHIDWVIKKAAEKGIFIGLLPTWGDKLDKQWGKGPEIFNTENASKYGIWLAKRYKDSPNIIWIIGGDRDGGGKNTEIWNAFGKSIKSVDKNHLMTLHPYGGHSSSEWFQNSDWLDFNMMQTGHCERSYAAYRNMLAVDYKKQPIKPTFDGEPRYEDHPVCWNPGVLGWFDDTDVRQAAYWNLFTGGFGHTYGCHPIWQFLSTDREPIGFARNTWQTDLDLPGSFDMVNVRRLMESRPFTSRIPFQELIISDQLSENLFIAATKGDGYAFIYFPGVLKATLNLALLGFPKASSWWYNPQTGEAVEGEKFDCKGNKDFTSPESGGRGNDYILVIDDVTRNYKKPGLIK
jgi:hypothetical protein